MVLWINKTLICRSIHIYIYIRSGDEQTKSKYNRYKNMLRVCIREAENKYYQNLFEDTRSSSYNLWKNIGPIINPSKKKKLNNVNKLVINGHSISDSKDISECMNNFFCNIGNDLQSVIPNTGDQYKHFLSERVESTFFLSPINTAELLREIKSLNPKKACGADGIGAKIILLCPDVFANNLTTIFNKALEIGEYPTLLKIAKVIPLYKMDRNAKQIIIDQSVYFHHLTKYLKKYYVNNLRISYNVIMCCSSTNSASENYTQLL